MLCIGSTVVNLTLNCSSGCTLRLSCTYATGCRRPATVRVASHSGGGNDSGKPPTVTTAEDDSEDQVQDRHNLWTKLLSGLVVVGLLLAVCDDTYDMCDQVVEPLRN